MNQSTGVSKHPTPTHVLDDESVVHFRTAASLKHTFPAVILYSLSNSSRHNDGINSMHNAVNIPYATVPTSPARLLENTRTAQEQARATAQNQCTDVSNHPTSTHWLDDESVVHLPFAISLKFTYSAGILYSISYRCRANSGIYSVHRAGSVPYATMPTAPAGLLETPCSATIRIMPEPEHR